MKINFKTLIAGITAVLGLLSMNSKAQTRKLPDGSIVYNDGTRKLPNGTVIYKDGARTRNHKNARVLPDGRTIYPGGTRKYPVGRKHNHGNGQWLPPGQAKKIYGGSARDYAPGQQKKWKKNHDWDDNNRRGHGNGKPGKGHKD